MGLRLPGQTGAMPGGRRTGVAQLDYELAGEMATSLGRAGRKAEEKLARLKAAEAEGEEARARLVEEAAQAVHAWFIQRELCGMRRHEGVIRDHAIPKAVLARLGAR
ncbi:MAG: hypothetical protein K5872_16450 [Rhizobiaceae bacterium]|nr:hypothetical protein [Rhizobiaceae bacterium]MCV0407813.1 hypothetical protein [Rhizobiaceae bacterium]